MSYGESETYCRVCGWPSHAAIHGPYWRDGVFVNEPYDHAFEPSDMSRIQASALKRKLYEEEKERQA